MECYEGAKMIKTFRGLIAAGAQDTIVLHTNDGGTGYRIKNFRVIPKSPTDNTVEAIMQIWKVSTTATDQIDFSNQTLLGSVFYNQDSTAANNISSVIIFDQDVFNQDIYITNVEGLSSSPMNYYLELEQVKLDLSESTVATLRDIRNLKKVAL